MLKLTWLRCSCWNSCTPLSLATNGRYGSSTPAAFAALSAASMILAADGGTPYACLTGGLTACLCRITGGSDVGSPVASSISTAGAASPKAFSIISTTPGTSA